MIIDADAHVLENTRTWDFIDPADQKYRPQIITLPGGRGQEAWFIDGKIRGQKFASLSEQELAAQSEKLGRNLVAPLESREMQDVSLHLKHMDQLGIDVEVLHNTIFIQEVADRPQVEVPLCRAWNRWVADIWKQGHGRLRWTCVPPVTSVPDALDELRFAKEHGAVGVIMRSLEGDRMIVDPYFYPLYEEAQRLDMPIIIHVSNANALVFDLYNSPFDPGSVGRFKAPVVTACHQVIMSELPALFPTLRWGIVEVGAQWLPWIVSESLRRFSARGREWPDEGFKAFRIYITCQPADDVPYILKYSGEDAIVIGTDYGHTDLSSDVDAIDVFRRTSLLEQRVVDKILDDNPSALYSIKAASTSGVSSEPALASR